MGGKGSGWYAENGHVAGSQGYSANGTAIPKGFSLTKDYLGNERVTTSTKQGGSISIYKTETSKGNFHFKVTGGEQYTMHKTVNDAVKFINKHYK